MEEKHEVDMDLSADDSEGQTEDQPPEPTSERVSEPSDERTRKQAERMLESASGETDQQTVDNAIKAGVDTMQQHQQQLQQVSQKQRSTEHEIGRLEATIERVEDLHEDDKCSQQLAGGVVTEVPAEGKRDDDGYDRADLIDDLKETKEKNEEDAEALLEKEKSMKMEVKVVEGAINRLQSLKDDLGMLDTQSQQTPTRRDRDRQLPMDDPGR